MTHFIARMPLSMTTRKRYPKRKIFRARFGRVRNVTVDVNEEGLVHESGSGWAWEPLGKEFFEDEQAAWDRLLAIAQGDVTKAKKELKQAEQRLKKFVAKYNARNQ
jgi:arginine/ornithine N-succinyltransferase beta subunit